MAHNVLLHQAASVGSVTMSVCLESNAKTVSKLWKSLFLLWSWESLLLTNTDTSYQNSCSELKGKRENKDLGLKRMFRKAPILNRGRVVGFFSNISSCFMTVSVSGIPSQGMQSVSNSTGSPVFE